MSELETTKAMCRRVGEHLPVSIVYSFRCKCGRSANLLSVFGGNTLWSLEVGEHSLPGVLVEFSSETMSVHCPEFAQYVVS